MIRHGFDQDLEALRRELLLMGEIVKQATKNAVTALKTKDIALAHSVMSGDDVIDRMQDEIEDKCIAMIARQQPVATDLRILGTGLKITTDLERIGDHAFDIAKIVLEIGDEPLIKPLVDIPRMAELAQAMLQDCLQAYLNLDIALAEKVCRDDDMVDDLFHTVFSDLLTYMMRDPATIRQATQLLFVARYLERISDHSTNVAEWVIYLVTGERLRTK